MNVPTRPDPTRTTRQEVLAVIDDLLARRAVSSVHYVGYAHEPILYLLHHYLGSAFSLMDYWDRYGVDTEFDWEFTGERLHDSRRPAWLEGATFYREGAPASELIIWDMPWHYPGQFAAIVSSTRRRPPDFKPGRPPNYWLLVDEACSDVSHPDYSWTITPHYALGARHGESADGLRKSQDGS